MKIYNLFERKEYIRNYVECCVSEWGNTKDNFEYEEKVNRKINKILDGDNNLISCLILLDNDSLVGFISLFKTDGINREDLTPWYATMYISKNYRRKGYSSILNDAILKEAKMLGYDKVYLKSNLVNYYEKFGAKYMEDLSNGEKLYYIELKEV